MKVKEDDMSATVYIPGIPEIIALAAAVAVVAVVLSYVASKHSRKNK